MAGHMRRLGWVRDLPDFRDLKYSPPMAASGLLPDHVDLRNEFPPPYSQGELGSCTAQSLAGVIEFHNRQAARPAVTPSRLFIYYNERWLMGTVRTDSGASLRDGIKSLTRWGHCPEPLWPYDITRFKRKPPQKCYRYASSNRISRYARLSGSLESLKGSLAEGRPFVFGFSVYESFEDRVGRSGVLDMPGGEENLLGGHAVAAVGYLEAERMFVIRNSWGGEWGDGGYFKMPYEYITNADLAADFWTLELAG